MSDRFVVEADKRVVGIAVRFPGGFRFFSSDKDFKPLEGRTFPRARSIVHRAAQLARRNRARATAPVPALSRAG